MAENRIDSAGKPDAEAGREIIIGGNSAIWKELSKDRAFAVRFSVLSHRDLRDFEFRVNDRVWIFSYSRLPSENDTMFNLLARRGVKDVVYISTATTNVATRTTCYEYPRVKLEAERSARTQLDARILVLGLVCCSEADLPAGVTMTTFYHDIRSFLTAPQWPEERGAPVLLFAEIERPFSSAFEKAAFRIYSRAIAAAGQWPCLLRPVDVILRALGWHWYGYLFLSNRLWSSTI